MPDEPTTKPDSHEVPNVVLEELLAAFSTKEADAAIDFDDPAIDRMLGLREDTGGVKPAEVNATGGWTVADDPSVAGLIKPAPTGPAGSEPEPAPSPSPEIGPTAAAVSPSRKLIVIGDDDRPDALYLDEEAGSRLREVHTGDDDSTGGRSTIIIKDLDESGSIEALPARSSGSMDPRVRARRIAVRRAKGRKRLIWVAIAAAILLVLVGAVAVLASSLFDVRTIDVQGAVYTNPDQLSAIVDGLRGEAILLVDTRKVERQLENIAWVESARVSTQFPHRVLIDIREREPIATFAGSDGKYRVIDRDGRVLDVVDGIPIDYMLVTGANPDVEQGQFAGRPFASAAQLAIALPAEIRALTESIGVDATAGDLTLQFRGKITVQLGPTADLSAKLVRLLSAVRGGLDGMCALDVSTTEITPTTCIG
jgi:cell division protein FtsQ